MADDTGSKVNAAQQGTGLVAAWRRQKADPIGAAARAKAWAEDNAEAIAAYNRYVEENGVFGEEWRTW